MPFKYFQSPRSSAHRCPEKKRNWSKYNKRMKMRGDITIWLSTNVIKQWHIADRTYDGNGAPHYHIIQTSELTDRKIHDMETVNDLITPMHNNVKQVTADTAYDANKIYQSLQNKFPNVDVAIPPKNGSIYNKENEWMRNRNIEEIQCYGRMTWQEKHQYGNRNHSECAIGRYKRILGNKLHAREFLRQQKSQLLAAAF